MLGTGTPTLQYKRAAQAILVVVDKNMSLFDAGPALCVTSRHWPASARTLCRLM